MPPSPLRATLRFARGNPPHLLSLSGGPPPPPSGLALETPTPLPGVTVCAFGALCKPFLLGVLDRLVGRQCEGQEACWGFACGGGRQDRRTQASVTSPGFPWCIAQETKGAGMRDCRQGAWRSFQPQPNHGRSARHRYSSNTPRRSMRHYDEILECFAGCKLQTMRKRGKRVLTREAPKFSRNRSWSKSTSRSCSPNASDRSAASHREVAPCTIATEDQHPHSNATCGFCSS